MYVGYEIMLLVIPHNVMLSNVESADCQDQKYPFMLKSLWKQVQVLTIDKIPICVVSNLDRYSRYLGPCLCMHTRYINPKVESELELIQDVELLRANFLSFFLSRRIIVLIIVFSAYKTLTLFSFLIISFSVPLQATTV